MVTIFHILNDRIAKYLQQFTGIRCLVVGWGGGKADEYTLCMYVFCKRERISSVHFKPLPSYPGRKNLPCFGASWKGRTFIGSFSSGRNEYSWTTYQFYEYDKGKKYWNRLAASKLQRQGAAICSISKDVLMISGGVQQVGENIMYNSVEVLKSKPNRLKFLPTFSRWKCYYSSQPHASLQYHIMTVIDDNNLVVVGGLPHTRISSNRVYIGNLKNNSYEVSWKSLEPLNEARHDHFAFRMGRYIIVGGGDQNSQYTGANYILSCERYNLDSGVWETTPHSLPFPLQRASAVVDSDQKFAFITGGTHGTYLQDRFIMLPGMKNKMFIYTEDKGFTSFNSSSVDILTGNHVAVNFN